MYGLRICIILLVVGLAWAWTQEEISKLLSAERTRLEAWAEGERKKAQSRTQDDLDNEVKNRVEKKRKELEETMSFTPGGEEQGLKKIADKLDAFEKKARNDVKAAWEKDKKKDYKDLIDKKLKLYEKHLLEKQRRFEEMLKGQRETLIEENLAQERAWKRRMSSEEIEAEVTKRFEKAKGGLRREAVEEAHKKNWSEEETREWLDKRSSEERLKLKETVTAEAMKSKPKLLTDKKIDEIIDRERKRFYGLTFRRVGDN
eukprot:TRINITY_DN7302_c0_g1_i1.p1 TRINITY_DN7302_c0_g1~~TRINITY_DN7302_c0_g1_i1.p1  ORF type:complete len:259 (-),score=105.24 TRINITY_DN7302_c0_g1_i1:135-911(-)